jgi:glycosyltransferase involved in cell wall biosynthesis
VPKIVDLNIHIYPSYLTNESRILRESKSLIDLSLVKRIEIIGYWRSGLQQEELISPDIKFIRVKTLLEKKAGSMKFMNLLSFAIFYLTIIAKCFNKKPDVVNCHTLTVLPLGFLLKFFFRVKLIYDPHELETETNDSRGFRKKISKLIERLLIHQAEAVIVVGRKIEEWYRTTYKLQNIVTIRNIPTVGIAKEGTGSLRTLLRIPPDEIIFIYVGILEKGRGILSLLKAFKRTDPSKHVVFIGYGSLDSHIEKEATNAPNIHLLPAVKSNEIVLYIKEANVGLCIIENTCLSYFYCLPNKSFEYISAGIPFISSRFPELVEEFESTGICWFVDPDTTDVFEVVSSMTKENIQHKKQNIMKVSNEWSWEEEALKYKQVYTKFISE